MDELEKKLWKDYEDASTLLNNMDFCSNDYKMVSEELDRIRNELLKLRQIDFDKQVKEDEIINTNRRERIKNIISIGTFACSAIISLITINKTFKFDEGATVTSTLGRNVLNGVIPKFFKH